MWNIWEFIKIIIIILHLAPTSAPPVWQWYLICLCLVITPVHRSKGTRGIKDIKSLFQESTSYSSLETILFSFYEKNKQQMWERHNYIRRLSEFLYKIFQHMRRDRDAMESLLVIINSRTPLSGNVWELRQRETVCLVSEDGCESIGQVWLLIIQSPTALPPSLSYPHKEAIAQAQEMKSSNEVAGFYPYGIEKIPFGIWILLSTNPRVEWTWFSFIT